MPPTETDLRVAESVRHCCQLLRERLDRLDARAGLLVGCGSGDEVVFFRRVFRNPRIVGTDLSSNFSSRARTEGLLAVADALRLPFPANTFDFVAAIHSLEHVGEARQALAEVARVLRPGGWFYVGVPNRKRLVGYLGSYNATGWQKIYWNLIDYSYRLRGRFENRFGAHAGFDAEQLTALLQIHFSDTRLLTADYLRFKYPSRLLRPLLGVLLSRFFLDYAAPSHYALCRKA
jgi:ubiquinone/menaquinone biosynthesis C-methylase UbiE